MILAVITGSTSDEYVTATASRLAKQMKFPVNLLYVIEVERNYPIDMEIPRADLFPLLWMKPGVLDG